MVCQICFKIFKTKNKTILPICTKCQKKKLKEIDLNKLERINNDQWELSMLLLKESPKSKENIILERITSINKVKDFIRIRREKYALHKKGR